jgi:putative transposase
MSHAKVSESDFIDFLIANPRQATATEAQRTQTDSVDPAAHDAYTRLLHRLEPDSNALWNEEGHERKSLVLLVKRCGLGGIVGAAW